MFSFPGVDIGIVSANDILLVLYICFWGGDWFFYVADMVRVSDISRGRAL